jgi:hypothetical protein
MSVEQLVNTIKQKLDDLGYLTDDNSDMPPSTELVTRLERMRGAVLPLDYQIFLELYPSSGHFSSRDVAAREVAPPFKTETGQVTVDEFFAYDPERGLEEKNRNDDQFTNMIWIGADVFGNRIYLDLKPESYGRVYWCDFESPNELNNLILVGNSFTHFIETLETDGTE